MRPRNRFMIMLIVIIQIIYSIPINAFADIKSLNIEDDQGNIISTLESDLDQTKYTRASSSEPLMGLGRNDSFKGFMTVTTDNSGKLSFVPTSQYDNVWKETLKETEKLYNLLKQFNDTSESGIGYAFELDDNYKIANQDSITKLKDLKKMYDEYSGTVIGEGGPNDTYKSPAPDTYEAIRINRLRILSLAIEYQSLKVQSLAGILLPMDLLLVTSKRTQEEAAKGTTAVIKAYKDLGYSSSETDLLNLDTTLTTAFNNSVADEAKFGTNESLANYDYTNSPYIEYLRQSKPEGLQLLTEIFDLVDTWSYAAPSLKDVAFKPDSSTTNAPSKDSIKSAYAGIGPIYSYLMADYQTTGYDNIGNAMSKYYIYRTMGAGTNATNTTSRYGDDTIVYTQSKTTPSISTMFSQLQFTRSSLTPMFNVGPNPMTVYRRIFNQSDSDTDKPLHLSATYYQKDLEPLMSTPYDSPAAVRGLNRFFITGLSNDVDGVDIFQTYFRTLLSITSKDTFVKIMEERYGYKYEIEDGKIKEHDPSDELKNALNNWDTNERFTFMYAVKLLNLTEAFYNKFGISVYTEEMQKQVNETISFISDELGDNGIKPMESQVSNKDTPDNQALTTLEGKMNANIVKDFVDKQEWGYELNADYKELFAWTACFVPFETNLYQEGANLPHVSTSARAKYRKYSRLRQPVSIVTHGENSTVNTEGVYQALISNSPQKLKYCTLDDFIKSSQSGDTFLFSTAVTRDDIIRNTVTYVDTDIQTNASNTSNASSTSQSSTDATNTADTSDTAAQSESSTEAQTEQTEASSEQSTDTATQSTDTATQPTDTATQPTDTVQPSDITMETKQKIVQEKQIASITSSEKYFGPVYAASNNPSYYENFNDMIASQSFLDNASYAIFEVSMFYNDPDAAKEIISKGIKSSEDRVMKSADVAAATKDAREKNDNSATGDTTDTAGTSDTTDTTDTTDTPIVEYSMATLMSLQISPQALYMNFANTYNMLQDKVYLQEGFNNDMNSYLYVDFLGNIITESGYVVVPAAANATRYTSLAEYPIFNAFMINSYPDVKQSPNDITLEGNDKDKYMIYMSTDYVSELFSKLANFDVTAFSDIREFLPDSKFTTITYLAKQSDRPDERLNIDMIEYKSYLDNKHPNRGTMAQRGTEEGSTENTTTSTEDGTAGNLASPVIEDKKQKLSQEQDDSVIDIITKNQKWFKEKSSKIRPFMNVMVTEKSFEGYLMKDVIDYIESNKLELAKEYMDYKIKTDKSLRTTYNQTLSSIKDTEVIDKLKWEEMPTTLKKGICYCINMYTVDDNYQLLMPTKVVNEETEEEEKKTTDDEANEEQGEVDVENKAGIPGKAVYELPDDRLGVTMITKDNLLSLRHHGKKVEDKDNQDLVKAVGVVYNVLNFKRNAVTIQGLTYEGIAGNATLDHVPPYGTSYEWLAIKTMNNNLYKIWESDPQKVNGVFVDCYINFNAAVGIMVAVSAGDEDTSVYDSDGTFLAGAGSAIEDNKLKENNVINFIGSLFESIYCPYMASLKTNMLTFAPTLDRIDVTNIFSLTILPFTMILLVAVAIILIYIMATLSLKNYNMTYTDVAGAFVLTLLTGMFIVEYSLPTNKFVFEKPGTMLMQDEILMQGLYDIENETKDKNNVYFLDEAQGFESSPTLYFGDVDVEECKTYRRNSNRPEVDFIFYLPQFDNNKQKISNDIFIQGKSAYISMYDLFKKSRLSMTRDASYNLYIVHQIDDDAKALIYYTPYYNFIEGFTNTINAYSSSCTGSYDVLNNKLGMTTTGRVKSYINSIFYVSPDDIVKYSDVTAKAIHDGEFVISKTSDEEMTPEQVALSTVRLQDGTVVSMDTNIVNTYTSMVEKIGDLNDWLELKRILYLTEDTSVFDEEYEDNVSASRWFPILENVKDDIILEKIERVNNNTKAFVANKLMDASAYISDENLIKTIALKATFEFNKEFGEYMLNGSMSAQPKEIMGYTGNNDYYTKSMYMPTQDIFRGAGKQFSYYVASKSSGVALAIISIERIAFILRTLVRNIGMFLLVISLFLLYVFYVLRNRLGNRYLSRALLFTFLLCQCNLLEVIQFLVGTLAANNGFDINGTMFLHLCLGITYTYVYIYLLRRIVPLWGKVLSSLGSLLPIVRARTAIQAGYDGYDFDSTEGMSMPEVSEVNDVESYNEPVSNYNSGEMEELSADLPVATDMLPLGDETEVPEGYNLYRVTDNGETSYFASQSDMYEVILPGGLHAYRYDSINAETQVNEAPEVPIDDIDGMIMPEGSYNNTNNITDDYI